MDLGLKGKKAIITGGSKGIGLATAHALADEGVDVAICSGKVEDVDAVELFIFAVPFTFIFSLQVTFPATFAVVVLFDSVIV